MQVKPQLLLVEKHVEGLGFKMADQGKKTCKVLLESKEENLKQLLMLTFYSMPLTGVFIPEGLMTLFISNHKAGVPFELDGFFQMMSTFADLLKNEHLFDHGITRERTAERVAFFASRGLIKVSADQKEISVVNSESSLSTINFFKALVLPLIDTYLVVLLAIEQLCGKNIVLKQKNLIKELHLAFKTLYTDGHIPYLHSCLKEIITTAMERFEELGFLEIRSYSSNKGATTNFMSCPTECQEKLNALLKQVSSQRNWSLNSEKEINTEIENVIMRVQGPLPLVARL